MIHCRSNRKERDMHQKQIDLLQMKAVVYDNFFDRLLSIYCTEGLMDLSVR
jgi:hypothetical protein